MPRIGVKCPVDGERIDDETCIACRTGCPRAQTHCVYTFEMLKGMMSSKGREHAHVSATMLGGCQRQTWLQAREDWHLDPERSYAALRGTVGHAFMEAHPEPGAIVEQRFELETPWGKLTGQIDKIHPGRKTITDFKTKPEDKRPLSKPQTDHIMQLNVYRYLVKHGWPQDPVKQGRKVLYRPGVPANIEIDRLELVYWTFGWVKQLEVPILEKREVLAHIERGMRALSRETPPDLPEDLDPVGHGHRGPSVLCRDWCPVRTHCLRHLLDQDDF